MDKTLREYAAENNIPISSAHFKAKKGTLGLETYKSNDGKIYVKEPKDEKPALNTILLRPEQTLMGSNMKPLEASTASTRRNAASSIERTDKYANIANGIDPIQFNKNKNGNCNISVREAISLTRLAYYSVGIIRNIIEIMTEFSTSEIYLTGGDKKSRDFWRAYLKKINYLDFEERFFREFFRSGSVFIFPYLAKIKESDIKQLSKTFGANIETSKASKVKIPVKYVILNPEDIELTGTSSFINPQYLKLLSAYELDALRNPRTEEDKEILESFDKETREKIKEKKSSNIYIKLPMDKIYAVFYKKQDYEAFAVPQIYSVLSDVNFKLELRNIDMAISRTVNQVVLLITMGYEGKDGSYHFNQSVAQAMQSIFQNESVGRVLISDFTTKAQFLIPDIAAILDPKKYESVDKDIREGLNHVLMGGGEEKFANRSMSIKLFIERLKAARESFLNNFLIPEIKKTSNELGFKTYPTPKFEEIDLKDETEYARMVTRLAEIGFLTPEETFTAIDSGRLPTGEESEEAQVKYKELRDKGFYEPITGGPNTQKEVLKETQKFQQKTQDKQLEHDDKQKTKDRKHAAENPQSPAPQIVLKAPTGLAQPKGRPGGSKSPKTKQKVKPVGASIDVDFDENENYFSLSKMKDNFILANELHNEVEKQLIQKHNVKELNEKQKECANEIAGIIIANESPLDWISKTKEYLQNPFDKNQDKINEINDLAYEYQTDFYSAAILYHCRKEVSVKETVSNEI